MMEEGLSPKLSSYGAIFGLVLGQMAGVKAGQDRWKDCLRKEWEETKTMPRKMKKRRRKEILLDWRFASYDPFYINETFNTFHEFFQ